MVLQQPSGRTNAKQAVPRSKQGGQEPSWSPLGGLGEPRVLQAEILGLLGNPGLNFSLPQQGLELSEPRPV